MFELVVENLLLGESSGLRMVCRRRPGLLDTVEESRRQWYYVSRFLSHSRSMMDVRLDGIDQLPESRTSILGLDLPD